MIVTEFIQSHFDRDIRCADPVAERYFIMRSSFLYLIDWAVCLCISMLLALGGDGDGGD